VRTFDHSRRDEAREQLRDAQASQQGPAAVVLSLQQSAGNAAVGRMLQRQPAVVDHTKDDQEYRAFIGAGDWAGVAALLGRYDDDRLRRDRVRWLTMWQTIQVAEYLRPGGRGGARPGPVRPIVEEFLRQWLDQEYPKALRQRDWSRVIILLKSYDEPDMVSRARQIQAMHGDAGVQEARQAGAAFLPADHLAMRALAFLPLETKTGAAARPFSQPAMNERTPVGPAVNVPGGKVTTYDNAGDVLTQTGWTALAYEGADAPSTGWLQFACREAEKFDAKGGSLGFVTGVTHSIAGQAEPLKWGTPQAPHWHIDARSPDAPFYESVDPVEGDAGAHVTTKDTTAIYDIPDPGLRVLGSAFSSEPKPAKLVERVKLHSYLVRGMEVLYENLVIVEFTAFHRNDTPQRKNIAGVGNETGRLIPIHNEALLRRFPAWNFYARR
jgi:hypothetical protein